MYGELVSSPVSGLSDVGDLDYMIPLVEFFCLLFFFSGGLRAS